MYNHTDNQDAGVRPDVAVIMTQTDSSQTVAKPQTAATSVEEKKPRADASSPKKRHGVSASVEASGIETLTYRDPFAGVYKKYAGSLVFSFPIFS